MSCRINIVNSLDCFDDQNGFYTLFQKNGQSKHINAKGKWIIDRIKENNDLRVLRSLYQEFFGGTTEQNDLNLFAFLQELQESGFIVFNHDFFDLTCLANKVHVAGEAEYALLSKTIQYNLMRKECLYTCSKNMQYYSDIMLRARGFQNQENYFVQYSENATFKNIIGFQNMSDLNIPTTICFILANEGLESLIAFYKDVEKKMRLYSQFKIRILISEDKIHELIEMFLLKSGFKKEATLLKEDRKHNYILYSKLLEET